MANAIRETNGQTLDLIVRAASEAKRRLQTGSKYQSSTNESDVNQFIPDAIPGLI